MATKRLNGHQKPTRKEYDARVQRCRELIGLGHTSGEVKRIVGEECGVSGRTAENYLGRARAEIREDLDQTFDEQRADAIAFYAGILVDESASHRDRLKARERMDKILGLDAPTKTAEMSRMSEAELDEQCRRLGIDRTPWVLPGGDGEEARRLGFTDPSEN